MIFSLEALDAFHGDSMFLHAGDKLVLIDGGPSGTYAKSLHPRLEELREQHGVDGELRIDLAMLSHIDDDHVVGLIEMAGELVELADDKQALPYVVRTLWHNSFDDILGNEADELRTAAHEALQGPPPEGGAEKARTAGMAVVASVANGRILRQHAERLGWGHNDPFDGLVIAPEQGAETIDLDDETRLTVVCPHVKQLEKLRKTWDKWLETKQKKEAGHVAAYADGSVFNLSSIVVLAEAGGKRILLCGDARGDHVLEGLAAAGLADDRGVTPLDLLKLPHHGSIHNVAQDFFDRLPARHYLISANGRDGNPETETLEMIVTSHEADDFEIHLTNHTGKKDIEQRLDAFVEEHKERRFKVSFRDPAQLSLRIDLGDETP